MIGDSVSLRAVDSFDGVFPHSHIDAEKGRQFDAGRATFEGYIQQNLAGKIVVFALGTNGLVTDAQVDAIMADAGEQRIVVFVNTRSPQPWVGSTNQAIANAATRYKNVRVIDWYGYSANRNDLFDGDGTHLSATGVAEYLNLIHDAVKKDLPCTPRTTSTIRSRQPSSPPPMRSSVPSPTSHTSWAPTSNAQPNLLTSAGASATADAPAAVRDTPFAPAPRDTPGAAMKTPTDEFQAAPDIVSAPRACPKQSKQALFAATPKVCGQKRPNMSTVTILVAGKITQNDIRATPTAPKAANLTALGRIGGQF